MPNQNQSRAIETAPITAPGGIPATGSDGRLTNQFQHQGQQQPQLALNGGQSSSLFRGSSLVNRGADLQLSQDQHRQLTSHILSTVFTTALQANMQQQPQHANIGAAAQLLLAQSQALGSAQAPYQLLMQQTRLQQLLQSQTHQPPNTLPASANGWSQNRESVEKDVPPIKETKEPSSSSRKNQNDLSSSHPSSFVPCRARGMSVGHNSSNAYFVIPHDVEHGENLLCSYPECRNEGVKFCYCSHCGIPVAKRNFRQRHDHGSKSSKKGGEAKTTKRANLARPGLSTSDPVRVNAKTQKQEVTRRNRASRSCSTDSSSDMNMAPMKSLVFPTSSKAVSNESEEVLAARIDETKRLRWATLLRERPLDTAGDEMSKWLLSVLAISNPKEPYDPQKKKGKKMHPPSRDYKRTPALRKTISRGTGTKDSGVADSASSTSGESSSFYSGSSDSKSDNFANDTGLGGNGPPRCRSNIVSDYRASAESSGPTDQSGGVDINSGTNDSSAPTSSGSGSNGSSEECSGGGDSPREESSSGSEQVRMDDAVETAEISSPPKKSATHIDNFANQRPAAKKRKLKVSVS